MINQGDRKMSRRKQAKPNRLNEEENGKIRLEGEHDLPQVDDDKEEESVKSFDEENSNHSSAENGESLN